MSQGDIVSQSSIHLWTRENELPSIPPAPVFPGPNEPWSEIAQSHGANGKNLGCLADFQSCALPNAELQQVPELPQAGMAYQGFIPIPRRPNCRGCCTCNPVVLETTPIGPQQRMNSSHRMSPDFDHLRSSGAREQTVPAHLFYNALPPEQVIPQNSGSFVENLKFHSIQAKIFIIG
jgi:hypothetical protein